MRTRTGTGRGPERQPLLRRPSATPRTLGPSGHDAFRGGVDSVPDAAGTKDTYPLPQGIPTGTLLRRRQRGAAVKRIAAVVVMVVAGLGSVGWAAPGAGAATDVPVPTTPYSGFDPSLTRAPYVTDLSQTSASVTWATLASARFDGRHPHLGNREQLHDQHPGGAAGPSHLGPPGRFASERHRPTVHREFDERAAVHGRDHRPEPQHHLLLPGLRRQRRSRSARLQPVADVTTLDPVSTSSTRSLTFDVVGDLGGASNFSSGTDFANDLNTDQTAIDSLIGSSGARFVVTTGDVAYSGGTQTNYGDLQQSGSEVSDVFGPSYWPLTGGIPTFGAVGNHGQNVDSLRVWPESTTTSDSGGTYGFASYPAVPADGVGTSTEPAAWYAVSTGNVRIYVLDASWADGNVGTSNLYQVDYDEHWTPASPEYQWLQADLASHPGGVKMAVFHFPLRSDNSTQGSDPLLQNSSADPNTPTTLEALLADNGVTLAFDGHTHTYQRISPRQPGQITNYVTGGGGGVLEPVTGGGTCTGLFASEDMLHARMEPERCRAHQRLGVVLRAGDQRTPVGGRRLQLPEGDGRRILGHGHPDQRRRPLLRRPHLHTHRQHLQSLDTDQRDGHGCLVDLDPGQLERLDRDRRDDHRVHGVPEHQRRRVRPAAAPGDGAGHQLHRRLRPTPGAVHLSGHRHRQHRTDLGTGHLQQGRHPVEPGRGHGYGHLGRFGTGRLDGLDRDRWEDRLLPDRPGRHHGGHRRRSDHHLHRHLGPAGHDLHLRRDRHRRHRRTVHAGTLQSGDHPHAVPPLQRAAARTGGRLVREPPAVRRGDGLGRPPRRERLLRGRRPR